MGLLTTIESNIATLIQGMTIAGGYNYDWGESNVVDTAKISVFPNAQIYLIDIDNQDDVDTGAHSQSYRQLGTFRIVVRGKLASVASKPKNAINAEHNDALDDLLKLFGNNYSIDSSCDVIFFRRAVRDEQQSGDVYSDSDLVTSWDIYYQQDRVDPAVMG